MKSVIFILSIFIFFQSICFSEVPEESREYLPVSPEKIRDPKAVPMLLNMLKEKDNQIRVRAISALGEIGNPDSVEELISLINDKDRAVQSEAVKALGKIKDQRAAKPLIAAFTDQMTDYTVKDKIADALAQIHDIHTVELLIDILKKRDYRDETRAATALGKIGDPKAIEPLFALLKDKEIPFITRNAAAEALGKIKNQKTLKLLTDALKDDDIYVRRQAGIALSILKNPDSIPFLLNAFDDTDKEVIRNAGFALSQIGIPAIDTLIIILKDKKRTDYARICAANALGTLNDPGSENALRSVAGDVKENQQIRRAANEGLQKIKEQKRYIK